MIKVLVGIILLLSKEHLSVCLSSNHSSHLISQQFLEEEMISSFKPAAKYLCADLFSKYFFVFSCLQTRKGKVYSGPL